MKLGLNLVCTTGSHLVRIEHDRRNGFYECTNLVTGEFLVIYRTLLTPMATIPSRFKEHMFAQVAEHLGTALLRYPSAVRIDPRPLAVDTMARKLREAIVAKQTYGWKHHFVDEALWASHIEKFKISVEPEGTILIGTGDAIKQRQIVTIGVAEESTDAVGVLPMLRLTSATTADIENICSLLHFRRFSPTPIVEISDLTPEQIESLEQRYDIAIIPLENKPNMFHITS